MRDGARQMLAAALLAEVAAYAEAHAEQLDAAGRRLVVRNGYHAPTRTSLTRWSEQVFDGDSREAQPPRNGSSCPRPAGHSPCLSNRMTRSQITQ